MLLVSKFNYQRLRGAGRALIYVSVIFLILVIIPPQPHRGDGQGRYPLAEDRRAVPALGDRQGGNRYLLCRQHFPEKRTKCAASATAFCPYAFILVVVAGLVAVEPHLSGAILILGARRGHDACGWHQLDLGRHCRWRGGWHGVCGFYLSSAITNPALYTGWTPGRMPRIRAISFPRASLPLAPAGCGDWALARADKIPVSAGGAQRFHFLHCLRGIGTGGRGDHHAAVRGADPPGLLDRPPHP